MIQHFLISTSAEDLTLRAIHLGAILFLLGVVYRYHRQLQRLTCERGPGEGVEGWGDVAAPRCMGALHPRRVREFYTLAEISPDPVFRYDRECRRTYVNPAVMRLSGKSWDYLIGTRPVEAPIVSLGEAKKATGMLQQVFATGKMVEGMVAHEIGNGRIHFYHNRYIPEIGEDGRIISVWSTATDITAIKQAEARLEQERVSLKAFFQALPDMAWIKDPNGVYLACNPMLEDYFGVPEAEIVGKTDFDFVDPDLASFFREHDKEAISAGHPCRYREWVTFPNDGRKAFIETIKAPLIDAQGRVTGVLGISHDITENERKDDALRAKTEELRALVENSPDGICRYDLEGRRIFVNSAFVRMADKPAEALLHYRPTDSYINNSTTGERARQAIRRVIEGGETVEIEMSWRKADGSLYCGQVRFVPEFGHDKAITSVLSVTRDISAIKEIETRLQRFVSNMPGFAFSYWQQPDGGGLIQFASPGVETLYGLQSESVIRNPRILMERFTSECTDGNGKFVQDIFQEAKPLHLEHSIMHPEKGKIWVELLAVPEKEADGSVMWHGIEIDITERKRLEEKLAQMFRVVEQSPASIIITNKEGNIIYVNPKFAEVTGYSAEEVLNQNPRFLKGGDMTPEQYRELWTSIGSGREWRGELHNRRKDGTLFWESALITPIFDQEGSIVQYLAVKEDITARKHMEEQLRQAQKMEVVGRLAGGVAHDFNNMLMVIQMNASLLQGDRELRSASELEYLNGIFKAVDSAAQLTRRLLTFSRRQGFSSRPIDIKRLAIETGAMIKRLIGENIKLNISCDLDSAPIQGDPGMIEQILLNLAVNARDAMPNGGGLKIVIAERIVTQAEARQRSSANHGRFIRLSVIDSGCGISPENQKRIFEPFFTTKDVGKGTGLGLATVYGIVEQHQGWIEMESAVGKGTSFHIQIPRLVQDKLEIPKTELRPSREAVGALECILLVEDDASIRHLVRRILERQKYRVIEAESGVHARREWEKHKAEIRLLITDIIMPEGMLGTELARQVMAEKPELKVIYFSGYNDEQLGANSPLRYEANFLEKPFVPQKLLAMVREALDGNPVVAAESSGATFAYMAG